VKILLPNFWTENANNSFVVKNKTPGFVLEKFSLIVQRLVPLFAVTFFYLFAFVFGVSQGPTEKTGHAAARAAQHYVTVEDRCT
jgi:hypothetical protein